LRDSTWLPYKANIINVAAAIKNPSRRNLAEIDRFIEICARFPRPGSFLLIAAGRLSVATVYHVNPYGG
jgi:hypothetical protein